MRILHFADVHLDRPLVGLPPDVGRRRRHELRAAFRRCLVAAREHNADLVTIGGDLWEDEHVTPDTRRFVASELKDLDLPVLMICGNHDPYLAGGNYARSAWPTNVQISRHDVVTQFRFDSVTLSVTRCDRLELVNAFGPPAPPRLTGARAPRRTP